jgi:hypothetical protein
MRKARWFSALAPHRRRPADPQGWPARLALPRAVAGALALAVLPALSGVSACGGGKDSPPEITQIKPDRAYNDNGVTISVFGRRFRPPLEIDTHSGSAGVDDSPLQVFLTPVDPAADPQPVEARNEDWVGDDEIDAGVAAGLPAGSYRVGLRDAGGRLAVSEVIFTSLGPDNDPPRIAFLQPRAGITVAPDSWVSVVASVGDDLGTVTGGQWCVSTPTLDCTPIPCVVELDGTCRYLFMAPTPATVLEKVEIELDVVDAMLNRATAILPIQVAWRPEITSLAPLTGPTAGGTELIVQGNQLIPGLSRILVDNHSIGGVIDGDTIRGVTQHHGPGIAYVALATGDSASVPMSFTFVAPPTIKLIDPVHAPAGTSPRLTVAGDYFTMETRFFWTQDGGAEQPIEPAADECSAPAPPYAVFQTDHRYIIILPPISGVIGLRAHDDIGGDSVLAGAFTFDPPP